MRPPHLGWILLCVGWIVCGTMLGLAYKLGYVVGNQGASYWRATSDSLRQVMRDGLCVRVPNSQRCEWMIPRDTIRRGTWRIPADSVRMNRPVLP